MKYFVAPGEDRRLTPTARASLRGSFINLSDGVTHYELAGPADGPVVLLTGGLTVPLFYWDPVADALHEHGLQTLAYSAYGRGYSDRVRGPYDEALLVRQLGELVETLQLPTPRHLVGASMGALVAMSYLRRHVPTTATLTLLGPAGLSHRPLAQKLLLGNDITAGLIARRLGRRIFDRHQSHNVADPQHAADLAAMIEDSYRYEGSLFAFFDTLRHFGLFDRDALYRDTAQLPVPTLLMWGTDDRVTPIDSLGRVRHLLVPNQVHVVDHCGHMVPFERPTLAAEKIAAFVTSSAGREST